MRVRLPPRPQNIKIMSRKEVIIVLVFFVFVIMIVIPYFALTVIEKRAQNKKNVEVNQNINSQNQKPKDDKTFKESITTFRSQSECEKATRATCVFASCDVAAEGQTVEETCGADSNGWMPLGQSQ